MIRGSCRGVSQWLSTLALCLASFWTCAWAAVYDLPADGSAVLGTDIRVKITDLDSLFDVARRLQSRTHRKSDAVGHGHADVGMTMSIDRELRDLDGLLS
jgi:hypothetical protein